MGGSKTLLIIITEDLAPEGGSRGVISVIILRCGSRRWLKGYHFCYYFKCCSRTLLTIITEDLAPDGGSRGMISLIISRCGSNTLSIIITEDMAPEGGSRGIISVIISRFQGVAPRHY